MSEQTIKGIAVSPGVAIGKVFILDSEDLVIPRRRIKKDDIPIQIARLEEALTKTRAEILQIQKKITEEMGVEHGQIFNAHLMVLEDRMLIEEVIGRLKKERLSIEYIFSQVMDKYSRVFAKIDDEYLRERTSDINDVGRRLIRNLIGRQRQSLAELKEEVIVIASDLSPSDTAMMHKEKVIGFATDIGGRTSHTAIMARSLEIPAVVGLETATQYIHDGDGVIIDGHHGLVVVNPTKRTIQRYVRERRKFKEFAQGLVSLRDLPAVTIDGKKIELAANIEVPEEVASTQAHGAEGIGLYRTEYFYMNRIDLPSEDEHYQAYRIVAEQVAPHPVVIRTLDLGGDKFLSHLDIPREMNPFLGWRAIRYCLARPYMFKSQLKAILRASVHGKLKLMYPMISGLEELLQANKFLEESKKELRGQGIDFDEDMEVGAMIEVPSAALTCDLLAREVDFFSIGTNDLIQYSLAVDRVNEKIAYLYEPAHPAVLRLIKNIIDTGHKHNIWVGMCGEMCAEPALALLLLGLGLDEFSTGAVIIPTLKKLIRSVTFSDAGKIAEEAMQLSMGKEVEKFMKKKFNKLMPDFLE